MDKTTGPYVFKKYTADTVFAAIASAAKALGNLVLLVVLSKMLGPQGYGVWAQVIATISLLMPLALLQLGWAMTRFLAAETDKTRISAGFFSVLTAATGTSILLSVLIFILAEPFATTFLKGAEAAVFVRLSAFLVLLTAIDQVLIEYFLAFRQVMKYAVFTIAQVVGELALITYLVFTGLGLYGAITALLIARSLLFLVGFCVIKQQVNFAAPALATLKPYLAFSLPLLPYSFCFWLIGVGDRYVIGHFLGATQVGLYSVAYGLGSIVQLLYMPLVVVLFPAITYLYENSMLPQIKTLCKYTLKFFLSLAIPAAFGLLILSKPLLRILTTQEFTKTSSIVSIVAFGTVFYSCSYIFSDLLMLFKKTKLVSFIFAGSASLNLLLNIMLVPLLGIMGAAISTLVTFGIHLVALSILTRRQITFDFDWKFLGKCLASSVLMDVIVWKLDPTSVQGIVISIMIGASIYLAFLIFLKGFNQGERAFLRNLIKRQFPSS